MTPKQSTMSTEGDSYRLYARVSELDARAARAEDTVAQLTQKVHDLEARLVNIEPRSEASALVTLGQEHTVPLHLVSEVYSGSTYLQSIFNDEGQVVSNTKNPDLPQGLARGAFPDDANPARCVYVTGDDLNEQSASLYHFLLFPMALLYKEKGECLPLYITRAGREKTKEELEADALVLPHCPSVIVELCAFRSLGYESAFQTAVHIAHGRKTFVVFPDEPLELSRFRSDIRELNFVGARTYFTERERQAELALLMDTLLGVYEKHFSNSVKRVCREGMTHFVKHIAGAHVAYLQKQVDATDAGFCAAWLNAVASIRVKTDVGLVFKAILSTIITQRGAHTSESETQKGEYIRLLHEMTYTPVTQTVTGRNIELKNAFRNAVGASPVLLGIVRI